MREHAGPQRKEQAMLALHTQTHTRSSHSLADPLSPLAIAQSPFQAPDAAQTCPARRRHALPGGRNSSTSPRVSLTDARSRVGAGAAGLLTRPVHWRKQGLHRERQRLSEDTPTTKRAVVFSPLSLLNGSLRRNRRTFLHGCQVTLATFLQDIVQGENRNILKTRNVKYKETKTL